MLVLCIEPPKYFNLVVYEACKQSCCYANIERVVQCRTHLPVCGTSLELLYGLHMSWGSTEKVLIPSAEEVMLMERTLRSSNIRKSEGVVSGLFCAWTGEKLSAHKVLNLTYAESSELP
jgi:hypothetical protein